MTINHVATIHSKDKATEEYHPIIDFLAQGPIDYSLVHEHVLLHAAGSQTWSSEQVADCKITILFSNDSFDITTDMLNVALHIPTNKPFDALATD